MVKLKNVTNKASGNDDDEVSSPIRRKFAPPQPMVEKTTAK